MSSLFFPGVSTLTHVNHVSNVTNARSMDPRSRSVLEELTLFQDAATNEPEEAAGTRCEECGDADHMLFEKDEVVCTNCGTQYEPPIDSSAEYRWYGSDDRGSDPTRVGHPVSPLFPESTSGTRTLCKPGANKAMRRIARYIQWTIRPYRERTLWGVFDMLEVRAAHAGIPKAIINETEHLYAQVSPHCICRGLLKEALVAACLYESLKRHGTPWRPADVAAIFQIDVKLVTRGFKQFAGLLDHHMYATAAKHTTTHEVVTEVETATHTTGFEHYLENALSRLLVPKAQQEAVAAFATKMGQQIDFLGICSEMTPSSLLGSALLLACEHYHLEKTTAEIAGVCKISAATLQKGMKKIGPWRPVLLKNLQTVEGDKKPAA